MPKTAGCDYPARGVQDGRLNEAPLVMTLLGPWVREEGTNAGKWSGKSSDDVECVTFDDKDVPDRLRGQPIDEIADAGCVHVDRENGVFWECPRQLDNRCRRTEPDVHDHIQARRPRAVERFDGEVCIHLGGTIEGSLLPGGYPTAARLERPNPRSENCRHSLSVADGRGSTYGGGVVIRLLAAVASVVLLAACGTASVDRDAAIACGWNEAPESMVSAVDADSEQLARNAERARIRWEAAQRVVEADDRFTPLADALGETANFAGELAGMSAADMAAIPTARWDFAKYAQAAARDQCRQLAALVGER